MLVILYQIQTNVFDLLVDNLQTHSEFEFYVPLNLKIVKLHLFFRKKKT